MRAARLDKPLEREERVICRFEWMGHFWRVVEPVCRITAEDGRVLARLRDREREKKMT